jgi:hypothetical protein
MADRQLGRSVRGMFARLACIGLGAAALVLAACSEGPPTVGQPRAFDNVCDKSNDGQRVAVEGFLRLPETISVIKNRRGTGSATEIVTVRLFQSGGYAGTPIGVNFDFGTNPNNMDELPQPAYSDSDLKVHLTDGRTATYGQRVKISGTVYFPNQVLKSDSVDFDCGLDNPLVEMTS